MRMIFVIVLAIAVGACNVTVQPPRALDSELYDEDRFGGPRGP